MGFLPGRPLALMRFMMTTSPHLDPSPILQTAFAFWSSKVLLTAVEFGVFTKLGNRRVSGAELGAELGLHPRAIGDFYSGADFRQWCGEAGFKRFEVIHLAGASSAAVAYK